MARPTTAPRLGKVVPQPLAAEVVERVFQHLSRLAVPLSPSTIHVDRTVPAGEHDLAWSVIDLCAWAQHGRGDPEEIEDLILNVAAPLYARPADGAAFSTPELDRSLETDPDDELALVLLAALARLHLVRREALSPRELGVLSGRTSYNVRHHIRETDDSEKKLKAGRDGLVAAAEAERWLRVMEVSDREAADIAARLASGKKARGD